MSETEHHKGRATEVKPLDGEDIEAIAKRVLDDKGITKDEYYDDYVDCLTDECRDEYIAVSGKLYKCETTEIDPCDDIYNATRNPDGSIDFEVKFYNGCAGLGESVGSAIDKMDKSKQDKH
ncbi:hypothetical protein KAR91_24415 [Candidatus Pacearchaeota archaeon]|nr:hypothetical protein [Candidatus Pacearchaeota archaeon]